MQMRLENGMLCIAPDPRAKHKEMKGGTQMKTRKFLSLLLALVMAFAMVIPAMADDPAPETTEAYTVPADVSGKIVILHTNDVHGGKEDSKTLMTLA